MRIHNVALLFFFQLIFLCAYSQSHPYKVKFSHQIESEVANGSLRSSKAGLLYSFIGEYQISNSYSDIPVSWGVDTLNLDSLHLVDAFSKIIQEAVNHQIVIISENHLKPQHRIFAKRIIRELSSHGFKHLGLETFSNQENNFALLDSELINRGYPLDSPMTGTYTLEPRMGQMVREAIQADYKLFAYERSVKIKGMDRDEIQAVNIIKYLNLYPNEKMVIFCGFHHAIESDLPKRQKHNWMAKYLKDKTGIDPLTIYQDNFTEKFITDEHPYLKQAYISQPSIFVNNEEKIIQLSPHVNIEVIHPKTSYRSGRPDWLFEDKNFKAVKITKEIEALRYPLIASAYKVDEVNSVPLDRVELKYKYDNKQFVLPPGNYRINLFDGENQLNFVITVN